MPVSTNATVQGVRDVLLPFSTSLEDGKIEKKIFFVAELINAKLRQSYTRATEPTAIRLAIEHYTAYNLIMTNFFESKLESPNWSIDEIRIEHGTDAYAIRDMAYDLRKQAEELYSSIGIKPRGASSDKTYPTGISGETWEYFEDDDINVDSI